MFNYINIYIFIPVNGCEGRGHVHCFARGGWGGGGGGGGYVAVKTALFTCTCNIAILQPMIQFLITGRFME